MKFQLSDYRPAVLVIDMQAVFISAAGPFQNRAMDPVVQRLNTFLDSCRALRIPVLFCNYRMRANGSDAGLLRGQPFLAHMLDDAPLIGVDPRIRRHTADRELRHHRPSAFFGTQLDTVLRESGCNAVVLTGVSVNNAISATARDAFAHDLPAIVVRDCVAAAPFEPTEDEHVYFQILDTWTAEVVDSADVLRRLGTTAGQTAQ